MKKTLTKILFISLLFSATVPATMQANLDWATGLFNFLRKPPVAAMVVIGTVAIAWKLSKVRQKLNKDLMIMRQRKLNKDLMIAVFDDDSEIIVKSLLANKADINSKGNIFPGMDHSYFDTPLTLAAYDNSKMVKLLLDNRADVNIKDSRGKTALMIAAKEAQNAEKLLEKTENAKNIEKLTEKKKEANDIIELLLKNGADPLIKAKDGTTVLDQSNNAIIRKFMQKKIFPILNNEEFSPLSSNLAQLTAELTY